MTVLAIKSVYDDSGARTAIHAVIDRVWYGNPAGPVVAPKFIVKGDFVVFCIGVGFTVEQRTVIEQKTEHDLIHDPSDLRLVKDQDIILVDFKSNSYYYLGFDDTEKFSYWLELMCPLYVNGSYQNEIYFAIVNLGLSPVKAVQRVHTLWECENHPVDFFSNISGELLHHKAIPAHIEDRLNDA